VQASAPTAASTSSCTPAYRWSQGDQTREFTAIRQGVIDMAIGSTINWSPQVKELNLFSLPFLMPDYKAIDALTQGEVGKDCSRSSRSRAWCRSPGARTASAR
jgi:TRAP-type C4-dicarboxylate transport system substrate-binding protein